MVYNWINIMIGISLLGVVGSWSLPLHLYRVYGLFTLLTSTIVFWFSCFLWISYSTLLGGFQFVTMLGFLPGQNLNFSIGVDGVSLFFLILTTILFPLCVLGGWDVGSRKYFMLILATMEMLLLFAFSVLDLFFFVVFFESLLLPMILLMIHWGTQERKTAALTYLYMYTLLGSVFILIALFMLYYTAQTLSFLFWVRMSGTAGMSETLGPAWLLLFAAFAIKVPILPVHIWLPEAHVEAPTVGSVLLAGLLLKLGGYGIGRFLLVFMADLSYYEVGTCLLCLASVVYASMMAIVQKDMKRIIAYSSVAHMNFGMLGYFTHTDFGVLGATCLMISHGIVSSALFFLIGVLYSRYGCRDVAVYGGLVVLMPIFISIFFIFSISNFSFPGTSNFVGELLVILGLCMHMVFIVLLVAMLGVFYGLVYSMLFFSAVSFGTLKLPRNARVMQDLVRIEFHIFAPLLGLNFYFGIAPTVFLTTMYASWTATLTDSEAPVAMGFTNADKNVFYDQNYHPFYSYPQVPYSAEFIEGAVESMEERHTFAWVWLEAKLRHWLVEYKTQLGVATPGQNKLGDDILMYWDAVSLGGVAPSFMTGPIFRLLSIMILPGSYYIPEIPTKYFGPIRFSMGEMVNFQLLVDARWEAGRGGVDKFYNKYSPHTHTHLNNLFARDDRSEAMDYLLSLQDPAFFNYAVQSNRAGWEARGRLLQELSDLVRADEAVGFAHLEELYDVALALSFESTADARQWFEDAGDGGLTKLLEGGSK